MKVCHESCLLLYRKLPNNPFHYILQANTSLSDYKSQLEKNLKENKLLQQNLSLASSSADEQSKQLMEQLSQAQKDLLEVTSDLQNTEKLLSEMRSCKSNLETEIESLKENNTASSEKSNFLLEKIETLQSEITELNSRFELELSNKTAHILKLNDTLSDKQSLLSEQTEIIEDLTSKLETKESDVAKLKEEFLLNGEKFDFYVSENKSMKTQIGAHEATINRLEEELLLALETNSTNDEGMKNSLDELNLKLAKSDEQCSIHLKALSDIESMRERERLDHETIVQNLTSTIEFKSKELEDLKSRLDVTETQAKNSNRAVQDLAEQLSKSQSEINRLIKDNEELSLNTSKIEADCFQVRQELDDALDENSYLKSKLGSFGINSEKELEDTRQEMFNLKESLVSVKNELKESEIKFKKSREECVELKEELKLSLQEVDDLRQSSKFAETKAAESHREMKHLRTNCFELKEEIENLKQELEQYQIKYDDLALESSHNSELVVLREENESLKAFIEEKDARIEKLNAAKLTKDQAKQIKKIKDEHKQLKKDVQRLQKEIAAKNAELKNIRNEASSSSHADKENSPSNANVIEALEQKLRKYATYCHSLESDKDSLTDAIKRVIPKEKIGLVEEDIVGAVNYVIHQLQEAEDECDAMASAEDRATSYLMEADRLRESNSALEKSMIATQQRVSELIKCKENYEEELNIRQKEISRLHNDIKSLRGVAATAQGDMVDIETKKEAQIQFLTRENRDLIKDNKKMRQEIQSLNIELNEARIGLVDGETEDLKGVSLDLNIASPMANLLNAEKENNPNTSISRRASQQTPSLSSIKKTKKKTRISMTPKKLVGLGSGDNINSVENNEESCAQS